MMAQTFSNGIPICSFMIIQSDWIACLIFRGHMPPNYHLTFSRSETTKDDTVKSILQNGGNVAVVYGDALPVWDFGAEVINGDETDLRFLDPRGKVVGLLYKRTVVKKDETGFVLTNRIKNLTKELA